MDEAGVSAEELAEQLEVARSTVYSWRNGTRVPHRDIQLPMARALKTSVAKLNGWSKI